MRTFLILACLVASAILAAALSPQERQSIIDRFGPKRQPPTPTHTDKPNFKLDNAGGRPRCSLNNANVIVVGTGPAGSTLVYRVDQIWTRSALHCFGYGNGNNISLTDPVGVQPPFCAYNTFESPLPQQSVMDISLETTPNAVGQQQYIWKNPARGGGTAYNTGVVTPQDRRLSDNIAALVGDDGWNSDAIRQSWNDITNYQQDGTFPTDPATNAWHGFDGPEPLSVWHMENSSYYLCKSFEAVLGDPCLPDANIGIYPGGGVQSRTFGTDAEGNIYVAMLSSKCSSRPAISM